MRLSSGARRKWGSAAAVLCVATAVVASGCGGDAPVSLDAGDGSVGADAGLAQPATPAEAAPPVLAPCPAGWRAITVAGGSSACDPWPEGGRTACTDDEMWAPGDSACARVGTACPADGLPDGLPTDRPAFFALAGAPAGGDGSRARPFSSLADALRAAAAAGGGIAAVGVGRYDGLFTIPGGVTLWGACPAETLLTTSLSGTAPVVRVAAAATIRNLAIRGTSHQALLVTGSAADLTLEDVIVRDGASGVVVTSSGRVSARGIAIRACDGNGISATGGASVDVTRAVLEGNRVVSLYVGDAGSSAVVSDVAVSDTRADATGAFGRGVAAETGAALEGRRVVVERNRGAGILGTDDTTVTLDWAVVRDTALDPVQAMGGVALGATRRASFVASHLLVERSGETAVVARSEGTHLSLSDAVVSETDVNTATGSKGAALSAELGGSLTATRCVLFGSHTAAAQASGALTEMILEDVVVADTAVDRRSGHRGHGIDVGVGAALRATRVRVERSVEAGLAFSDVGTTGTLVDLVVRDTASDPMFGRGGYGLATQFGASLDVTRAAIARSHAFGIIAISPGSQAVLRDVVVTDTEQAACADACPTTSFGTALAAFQGGQLALTGFAVRGASLCGAHVASDASMDLADGDVSRCTIGACIQVDGYDVARLSNRVSYADNDRSLDLTMLPVPDTLGF